ncbi:hypothetical protein BCR36DRAFT_39072 [Piromyces finnis]|uniref:Uncharacterized protein n=1 Tax=Piromyces finnis TaxID=1754191 RepID=A0A1Y1VCI3_9FUNG|nr:hypothetical protein BCR36DRAFT_39072 [Piromyces finnis]|eukprot:ORX51859.1 hypothetical protein BCR36DRAFT_39072 [Piromyces finnis]
MFQEEVIYDDSPLADYFNSINENFEFTTIDTDHREGIKDKNKKYYGRFLNTWHKMSRHCKMTALNFYETLMGENTSSLVDLEELSLLIEPFLKYLAKMLTSTQFEDLMKERISALPPSTKKYIIFPRRGEESLISNKINPYKTLAIGLAVPTIVLKKLNKHFSVKIPFISGNVNTILFSYYTIFLFLFMVTIMINK